MNSLWSYFTPNVLIIILGVVCIGVLLALYKKSIEGFEGDLSGIQEAISGDASVTDVSGSLGLLPPTDASAPPPPTDNSTPQPPSNPPSGSAIASIVVSLPNPSAATSTADGNVPDVSQSSMVPSDTGAATSPNPTQSTPQPTDIAATMESLANFNLLATQKLASVTNMSTADLTEAQKLQNMYPLFQNELLSAAADPTTTSLTVSDLNTFRAHLDSMTNALRNASMTGGVDYSGNNNLSSSVTTVATPSDTLNMNDLQNLKQRTDDESLKLTNLRSSAPTITQRKNQLDSISADLNDMIVKLQNGQMQPTDIPITQDAANAFLAALGQTTAPIPALFPPNGTQMQAAAQPNATASAMAAAMAPGGNAALTQLMNNAQYLKWNIDVSIGFDPNAALRGRMLDRLESIEKTLTNLIISETPPTPQMISAYRKEMETIQQMLVSQVSDNSSVVAIDPLPTSYTRFNTDIQAPTEDTVPTPNQPTMSSNSMPASIPTDGSLPNGRVSMMGPDRVNGDGRVQLRNMPLPQTNNSYDNNYGQATPSDMNSGVYALPPQRTQCNTPPSNTMFALPMSYGAITPDMINSAPSQFNAQPFYNMPSVTPNVNALYTPPPPVTVPVYMTAYTPASQNVAASAADAHASQPGWFVPKATTSEGFTSSAFPNAGPQPDSKIRPGFSMNDDSIARRASASAFDPSTVGGPDYKQRAQDLCRQIGQAELAPASNFGCIANPDEVGPDYSWKGNYQMICNRLGDTWGGWYPEMVGCPPSNPTAKFQGQ